MLTLSNCFKVWCVRSALSLLARSFKNDLDLMTLARQGSVCRGKGQNEISNKDARNTQSGTREGTT